MKIILHIILIIVIIDILSFTAWQFVDYKPYTGYTVGFGAITNKIIN